MIGLGQEGIALAVTLASSGYNVAGVKTGDEHSRLERVPVESRDRLTVHMNFHKATHKANVIVLAPESCRPDEANSTRDHLISACESIGGVLASARGYRLVVVATTVAPGWMTGLIQATLERVSGRRAGSDFGLCYWPFATGARTSIEAVERPSFVLIGESDPAAGRYLVRLTERLWERPAPAIRMSLADAELASLASGSSIGPSGHLRWRS